MNPNDPQDRQQMPIGNQQSSAVSTPQKEASPIPSKEPILQSAGEYAPPKEVEHLVSIKQDKPEIPPDIKQMGVSHPPSQMPVSDVTTISPTLPLTDDQIEDGLHEDVKSGYRWLAEWCLLQLKRMHIHLKKVHGHFMRIMDNKVRS